MVEYIRHLDWNIWLDTYACILLDIFILGFNDNIVLANGKVMSTRM
jgi:hypothetical protein